MRKIKHFVAGLPTLLLSTTSTGGGSVNPVGRSFLACPRLFARLFMSKPRLILFALSLACASLASAQPVAPLTEVALQGGDYHRVRIGDVMVTALSDGTISFDLHKHLTNTTPAKVDALLHQNFENNPVEASINTYLIELPGRLVLVDVGVGELFGPGNGGLLLESLTAAGYQPDQVTDILITHVHTDHSGGLVKGGQRLFTNATVHVGQPDLDFFLGANQAKRAGYPSTFFDEAAKTLKPYVDAGKVAGFSGTEEVVPGITATVHPGHTPGSAFYTLASRGKTLTFVGDLIHFAPVQLPDPSVTFLYDFDAKAAAANRRTALQVFARDRTLIAVPHFSFPGIGYVRASGKNFQWVPISYGNRKVN